MMHIAKMVSMELDPEVSKEMYGSPLDGEGSVPRYPFGLCISLSEKELDKLGLGGDCDVGDMIHIFAMCKVTSVSERETSDGNKCRVELQITDMSCENEDEENEEMDRTSRYGDDY